MMEVGAVAAIIVLVVGIAMRGVTHNSRADRLAVHQIADVNGDGVVDIRDALLLARKLDSGNAVSGRDVNHDGITDRKDVDAIAMLAVRLPHAGATR